MCVYRTSTDQGSNESQLFLLRLSCEIDLVLWGDQSLVTCRQSVTAAADDSGCRYVAVILQLIVWWQCLVIMMSLKIPPSEEVRSWNVDQVQEFLTQVRWCIIGIIVILFVLIKAHVSITIFVFKESKTYSDFSSI